MGVAAPLRISSTARPRSLVPSDLKRKTPSAPTKPDGLVSTGSENRCEPWVRASAAAIDTALEEGGASRAGPPPYRPRYRVEKDMKPAVSGDANQPPCKAVTLKAR